MTLYWSSWADFIAMGGYGLYVWGSFGVTALVLLTELWMLRLRRRALTSESAE
jgi:heme exporter protein D